jgi:hypothetical protein
MATQKPIERTELPATPGTKRHPSGETEGLLPREIAYATWENLGHTHKPLLRVLRDKSLDCSHTDSEVAKCTATRCALWPYRMGTNPLRQQSEAELAARKASGERLKAARQTKDVPAQRKTPKKIGDRKLPL